MAVQGYGSVPPRIGIARPGSGIIGKELKNGLSNTWVNYAVPVGATVEVRQGEQTVTLSLPEFVAKGMRGDYLLRGHPYAREFLYFRSEVFRPEHLADLGLTLPARPVLLVKLHEAHR